MNPIDDTRNTDKKTVQETGPSSLRETVMFSGHLCQMIEMRLLRVCLMLRSRVNAGTNAIVVEAQGYLT